MQATAHSGEMLLTPENIWYLSDIMTDDEDNGLERFVDQINPLTLSDADSDDSDTELKSIEHSLTPVKSYVNKALDFVTAKKELSEAEHNLKDLLQEATKKKAISATNLYAKRQHRRMRDIQMRKKLSSNSNEKNECGTRTPKDERLGQHLVQFILR